MFGEEAAGYQRYWIEESRALTNKSSAGELILAEDSTHQLHVDAQDLVVDQVLAVIERARNGR